MGTRVAQPPRWLGHGLAAATEVGRPAREADSLDRRRAAPARLSRASIDAEFILVLPAETRAADVIPDGRAAALDGPIEYSHDGLAQPLRLDGAGLSAQSARRQPCLIERLIG